MAICIIINTWASHITALHQFGNTHILNHKMDIKRGINELFSYNNQIIYGLVTTLITSGLYINGHQRYEYDSEKMFSYAHILIIAYFSYQLYLASEKKYSYSSIGWFFMKFAEVVCLFNEIENSYYHLRVFPFSIVIVIILIQMVLMWLNQLILDNNYDDILSLTPEITIQK